MKFFIKNDCPNCHELQTLIAIPEEDMVNVDEDFVALAELIEQGITEAPVLRNNSGQYCVGLEEIKEYWEAL